MNPELKQRLIGAAVVTALATIFIPMMFDDPVENKGQTVSELKIPETPVKSTEQSANKLPTPATNKTTATKSNVNPADEVSDAELDDPEAEANAEPPVNETTPAQQTENGTETVAEAESTEEEPEPLDTGVVPEAKTPIKKATDKPKTTEPEVVVEDVKVKSTMKKNDKTIVVSKPVEPPANTKPVVNKKPETPTPVPTSTTEKPKTPELSRWTIHAGSFAQKDNATALMKTLREQHIPVVMETIPSAKGTMYRLKIGPELDKKKAAANKAKLDKQGVTNVMFAE